MSPCAFCLPRWFPGLRPGAGILMLVVAGWMAGPAAALGDEEKEKKSEPKTSTKEASESKEAESKEAEAKESEARKKPRVFTNADLAKYAKKSTAKRQVSGKPQALAPPMPPPAADPGTARPRVNLPVDRLETMSLPDLETRRRELAELLTYLEKKVSWFKNPLQRPPEPPYGEELLDPTLSGGQEFQLTRTRIVAVRGRLQKVESLIHATSGPTR